MNFFVISIRKNLFTILFIIFTLSLFLFSSTNFIAAQKGILLWATTILPSLFPFFIATELLCKTNFIQILGKFLNKFMKPIFNVPGESATALILGTISGYPVGAKVICNLKNQKLINKYEAERLLAYTNNSGPLFILSSVGVALFHNKKIGIILLISHLISALIVGFIFRNWKKNKTVITSSTFQKKESQMIKISDLGEILSDSIKNSIITVLTIGGFVILFSVIISILQNSGVFILLSDFLYNFGISKDFSFALFSGILELTNGMSNSSFFYNTSPITSILLTSFLLGFGGLSIMFQIYSIIAKEGISIKPYILGKFLQGIFSVLITALMITF